MITSIVMSNDQDSVPYLLWAARDMMLGDELHSELQNDNGRPCKANRYRVGKSHRYKLYLSIFLYPVPATIGLGSSVRRYVQLS